jgi:hypothetical protein
MYPGAIEAFDRAIATDPGFALAHAARAHSLLERGEATCDSDPSSSGRRFQCSQPDPLHLVLGEPLLRAVVQLRRAAGSRGLKRVAAARRSLSFGK